MNSKHVFWGMVALLFAMVALTVGGTWYANKLLQTESKKLSNLKLSADVLGEQQNQLGKAKKELTTYDDLLKIAKTVVPQDKDQAEAVREIVNLAAANHIKLATITFPTSTLGQTTTGGGAGASAAPKPATGSASSALTQVKPVPNIAGVYDLQILLQSDESNPPTYAQFISFLSSLEQNRRTAQVNAVTIQPAKGNRALLTFNLTIDEYIKP
jgi:hypothetical protein